MDVTQVSNLVNLLRKDILRAFKTWADSVPEPDKPFIGTASGELFSPREIVQHIESETPEGDEFVQDWIRVAINKATFEMLQPQAPVPMIPEVVDPAAADFAPAALELSIADLGLSMRAANWLESEGISNVRDLVACSEDQLLQVRNFGETTLAEVKEKLSTFGLSLVDEPTTESITDADEPTAESVM